MRVARAHARPAAHARVCAGVRGPAARPLALRDRSRAHAFLGTRRESRPFNDREREVPCASRPARARARPAAPAQRFVGSGGSPAVVAARAQSTNSPS
ncbi:hypothetical protein AQ869_26675 [Burkholderia pseudomallei]|nr:hypothetical protein AQ867_09335 [Burkholderia pseudomallei]OMZ78614.1 hypothetical protein AQ868_13220 [Burkholderia pseudomallei]OMZ88612.1 hypothetical protein AQ869_26675 [Burkholderia pseudomallei]ONA63501.1 hypothetical protein AQ886_09585 [Burkholderia pseudomallei]ONA66731.1 hypothetical protein AQ884_19415 [Burkholderia pseudomallei]